MGFLCVLWLAAGEAMLCVSSMLTCGVVKSITAVSSLSKLLVAKAVRGALKPWSSPRLKAAWYVTCSAIATLASGCSWPAL